MGEFSLTTVFVVPPSNVLPTSGGTELQAAGVFSVRKDEARTIATNGNIATADFIQFFQGRDPSLSLGSKPSDRIKASKVKKWYKVIGSGSAANEIWDISDFTAKCGESVTLTFRAHSSYIDTLSFNGLQRSVTVQAPCCECDADPCTEIDNEALVDLILAKVAQTTAAQIGNQALKLDSFFTFMKLGTGADATIRIESKALTAYGQPCDLAVNPYEFDRIWFRVWVTNGPATTVDFEIADNCDVTATTTLVQRSSYPSLTSKEVAQMEIDYYSYQAPFKHLFRNPGYNPYFESFVVDGTVYDQYVIQFDEYNQNDSFIANLKEDERVIIYFPTGEGSVVETMLETYLGTAIDVSAAAITTTTTTSTTSTTSTTTTTLVP